MDLLPFINKAGCECLNESDEHGFENCLRKDSSYLESDCDEQVCCHSSRDCCIPGMFSCRDCCDPGVFSHPQETLAGLVAQLQGLL